MFAWKSFSAIFNVPQSNQIFSVCCYREWVFLRWVKNNNNEQNASFIQFKIKPKSKDLNTKNQLKASNMIMLTLVVILVVMGLIKYFLHMRHMESYVKHLPTMHPVYPLIGNAHFFIGKSTTELFSGIVKFINDNETPSKAYIGPILNITLDKPEDIRTILMSSSCLNKPYMYRFLPSTVVSEKVHDYFLSFCSCVLYWVN